MKFCTAVKKTHFQVDQVGSLDHVGRLEMRIPSRLRLSDDSAPDIEPRLTAATNQKATQTNQTHRNRAWFGNVWVATRRY